MEVLKSEFDSEVLGISVAKLSGTPRSEEDVRAIIDVASGKGFRVVFWSAFYEKTIELESYIRAMGNFCSTKVKYRIHLNDSLVSAVSLSARSANVREYDSLEASPELIELSKHAGGDSRFYHDPNLSYKQFENLYTAWIQSSTQKEAANVVLTSFENSRMTGLVTVKLDSVANSASIVLLAVHPDHRHQGVGKSLMAAALRWTHQNGFSICEVVTQSSNKGARALYEKCGGILVSKTVDFHLWIASTPFNDPVTSSNIPGNKPYITGGEIRNLELVFRSQEVATHSKFGKLCQERLESETGALKALLVTSGTSALELCSLAIKTVPGDEIIMPSYTFVSTATAFVNHGGMPVFVDIRRDTQNIDETKIEGAITEKTKAIVVVHYAGVPCEMDAIMDIASRHNLYVIEDNAHGIFSTYKGKQLGTIGHLGAHSFHYTKNISCGEGGAVLVNRPELIAPCLVAWEKGTNRFDFLAGKVDKYAWVDRGSSFVLSEINAAVLAAQLESRHHIFSLRENIWSMYRTGLQPLQDEGKLLLPYIPPQCTHNSHIFYVRVLDEEAFKRLAALSKARKVGIFTHYIPLQLSTGGKLYGRASGELHESVACNEQLYRLPMWPGLQQADVQTVVSLVFEAVRGL